LRVKKFMGKITAYDVFIGIFANFPKEKNRFRGYYSDVIDFLAEQRKNYSILKGFTREELEGGLDNLSDAGMLGYLTYSPGIKEFRRGAVDSSFKDFNKEGLFGEEGMKEVKDLSEKFVEKFA
jgi:hypothetical protein